MMKRKLETLSLAVLTGALVLGAAACKQKVETTTAEVAPPGETVTTTTTTTTTTTAAELVPDTGTDTTVVTADPVRVSQRNATRRRASRSTSTGTTRETGERSAPEQPVRAASRVVPEGTILRVAFDEPISTATAKEGDTVRGRLLDDILDTQGRVAIASGSRVVGMIEHAVDSGRLARPAELRMRLSEVETRRGMVPVQTSVYDRVGKTHTKRNVGYIAGGAAVGAAVGQILGKDTESTLKGAAAGAVVGTGVAAATGERDFSIEAGQTVAFTLQEDVVA
jgi:hypothetical protein